MGIFPPFDNDRTDDFELNGYNKSLSEYRHYRGYPSRDLRKDHCAIGINGIIEPEPISTLLDNTPDFNFAAEWLVVLTSGFWIQEFVIGNRRILGNIDADLFYRANWYNLERVGQLDLVRLPIVAISPSTKWRLRLTHRGTKPAEFRAALVGSSVITEYCLK